MKHEVYVYFRVGDGLVEPHDSAESVAIRVAELDAIFNPKESG